LFSVLLVLFYLHHTAVGRLAAAYFGTKTPKEILRFRDTFVPVYWKTGDVYMKCFSLQGMMLASGKKYLNRPKHISK
jgi:hypothetical protein